LTAKGRFHGQHRRHEVRQARFPEGTPVSRRYTEVSLDQIATDATVVSKRTPMNPLVPLAALAASAVLVGAVFAGISLPAVFAATTVANRITDAWEGFPADLPPASALPQHTVLLDKNGTEYARFYSENRIEVPFEQISPTFLNALVATEDARFYEHNGVDVIGITRAAVKNFQNERVTEGGSTITQQLVQNILISSATTDEEKAVAEGTTYEAKLREAKYAINLEKKMTKQEILTSYSNAVFLGNRAYGVQAAARVYFNTDAAALTIPQSAMLVALLRSPIEYDPYVYPAVALERRDLVIERMATTGYITAEEAAAAIATPIELSRGEIPTGCATSTYPYYCALVRDELLTSTAFGSTPEQRQETLRRGGMTLTTALDPVAADAAQRAVNAALGTENRVAAGTAVVVPGTGHIAAVAQNRTWAQTEIVYAQSAFQTGSVMKPLTLATALEQGMSLNTKFEANNPYVSKTLDSPKKGGYTNFGKVNHGVIDARTAIRLSVNVYFVKMIEKAGVINVAKMAERLGVTSLNIDGMSGREGSFALGTAEISPLDMATVYATFASGGVKCTPVAITAAIRSTTGAPLPVPATDCHQEIDSTVAAQMNDALTGPFRAGTLSGVGGLPGRQVGGKTGTTDENSANWTVGMTPQFSTAVWVGDPRGGVQYPLKRVQAYGRTISNTTGSSIAGPIWKSIMVDVHAGQPVVRFPAANASVTAVPPEDQVPNVRGLSTADAIARLQSAGFTAEVAAEPAADDGIARPDVVVGQSPTPGTGAPDGKVMLTLSFGSTTTAPGTG
jgi:membrane peptidoglycan carboxypeptidase